ncbi:hypothetical protein UFOVP331_134 [uncultured Caudovirales phage]|uniref:Uncharacterized protein n=1 Tax=uncultured Caudovirales phage TaxID=2100421 RepID=A0A6J5LVG5_9CAUD|nr:hypothetical protein UFOVP331_134 [uncultured Caudovirales phage]
MTHREFKLVVKKEILEHAGYSTPAVHYKVGDVITVNEDVFTNLQSGETIKRFTREGSIEFDKYNFENEVEYTQMTIDYGTRKLGQRNNNK